MEEWGNGGSGLFGMQGRAEVVKWLLRREEGGVERKSRS